MEAAVGVSGEIGRGRRLMARTATRLASAEIRANNASPEYGAAYAYFRSGAMWTQQAYLKEIEHKCLATISANSRRNLRTHRRSRRSWRRQRRGGCQRESRRHSAPRRRAPPTSSNVSAPTGPAGVPEGRRTPKLRRLLRQNAVAIDGDTLVGLAPEANAAARPAPSPRSRRRWPPERARARSPSPRRRSRRRGRRAGCGRSAGGGWRAAASAGRRPRGCRRAAAPGPRRGRRRSTITEGLKRLTEAASTSPISRPDSRTSWTAAGSPARASSTTRARVGGLEALGA